jgi:hypothetical protein
MSTTEPPPAPILVVVIDTEEEREWGIYSRNDVSVSAIRHVDRAQAIFDEFHVRPTYVVDYPVASQAVAYGPLRDILASGRAAVGAHLHPWVNPPYLEEIVRRNTYPGNLPGELEQVKIENLVAEIECHLGERPTVYKAGRYGTGPNTVSILDRLGFEVDLSTSPPYDLRQDGGPDYRRCSPAPYWLNDRLLELPTTGAFIGALRSAGPWLYSWVTHPRLRWSALAGISSRLGLLGRVRLSPEGHDFRDQKELTEGLLSRGVSIFTWSFHSPSLQPGGSPYVKSNADLERFLGANRRYFEYFMGDLGGVAMTPLEVRRKLLTCRSASGAL